MVETNIFEEIDRFTFGTRPKAKPKKKGPTLEEELTTFERIQKSRQKQRTILARAKEGFFKEEAKRKQEQSKRIKSILTKPRKISRGVRFVPRGAGAVRLGNPFVGRLGNPFAKEPRNPFID